MHFRLIFPLHRRIIRAGKEEDKVAQESPETKFLTGVKGGLAETIILQLFRTVNINAQPFEVWYEKKKRPSGFRPYDKYPDIWVPEANGNPESLIQVKFRDRGLMSEKYHQKALNQEQYWDSRGMPYGLLMINDSEPPYLRILDLAVTERRGELISYPKYSEFTNYWTFDPVVYKRATELIEKGVFAAWTGQS